MRPLPFVISALLLTVPLAAPPDAQAGWDEGQAAYQRKDWPTAVQELKPLAEGGHVGALSRLGHMTLHGYGVAKNEPEALRLLLRAAEGGDALAQNTVGGMYFRGMGTMPDTQKAVQWFSRAADQDQPNALNNLGQLYLNGNGVPRDEVKALSLLHRAADKGIPAAWEALGLIYWNGRAGVPADHTEAVRWFRKAAERGLMLAQNRLGNALWTGDGTTKNLSEAVRWFELAAAQGDGASLYNMALACQHGAGTAKDPAKAARFAILAVRQAKPADKARFEDMRDKLRDTTDPAVWTAAETEARTWTPRATGGDAAGTPASPAMPAPSAPPISTEAPPPAAPARPQLTSGSGIVVNRQGAVLTNSHVVKSCRNIRVSLEGQPAQAAAVVARDDGNDLAVLKASLQPGDVARFREDKPMRAGDGVVVIGYPLSSYLSREPNVTIGVISALAGIKGDKRHYQITAPVQKGNSGGPVADQSGNVVGIVTAKLDAMKIADKTGDLPQNVNFAIKSELARKFLSDNAIGFETAPAVGQLQPADVGDIVKKATVFVECEG